MYKRPNDDQKKFFAFTAAYLACVTLLYAFKM